MNISEIINNQKAMQKYRIISKYNFLQLTKDKSTDYVIQENEINDLRQIWMIASVSVGNPSSPFRIINMKNKKALDLEVDSKEDGIRIKLREIKNVKTQYWYFNIDIKYPYYVYILNAFSSKVLSSPINNPTQLGTTFIQVTKKDVEGIAPYNFEIISI